MELCDLIEVECDVYVDVENGKVVTHYPEDDRVSCENITREEVEEWNLWDYFYDDAFDENGIYCM